MYNFGYVVVDFEGFNVSSETSVHIDNISERIHDAAATGKPIVIANLTNAGDYLTPVFAVVTPTATGYLTDVIVEVLEITSATDTVAVYVPEEVQNPNPEVPESGFGG